MSTATADYSIWVLEYGQTVNQPVSVALYGQHNAGVKAMPYGFVVAESRDRVVLVDTGFAAVGSGEVYRRKFEVEPYISPADALHEIGRTAEEVTDVIVTHAHYDHMGGLDLFPNAHFYLQHEELEKWRWALGLGPRYANITAACNPDDVARAERLVAEKRMTLLDGRVDNLLPGISVELSPNGHSYMLQYAVIDTASSGRYIAAGDVAFSRLNLTGLNNDGVLVPLGFGVGSQTQMVLAMDEALRAVEGEVERVLIVHEPLTYLGPSAWTGQRGLRVAEVAVARGTTSKCSQKV